MDSPHHQAGLHEELDDYSGGGGGGGGGGLGAGDELSLPKTTLSKIIQDLLPANITCTKETKDLLTDACVEFIHLLASEANDLQERDAKKTMNADHILKALSALGFEGFVGPCTAIQQDVSHANKEAKQRKKAASSNRPGEGMTEAELLQAQEDMFAKARAKYEAAQLAGASSGGNPSSTTGEAPPSI